MCQLIQGGLSSVLRSGAVSRPVQAAADKNLSQPRPIPLMTHALCFCVQGCDCQSHYRTLHSTCHMRLNLFSLHAFFINSKQTDMMLYNTDPNCRLASAIKAEEELEVLCVDCPKLT